MAHTPQERSENVGWPKRLILTSDVNDYPSALIANADFVVSYGGAVIKHRHGKCEIAATDADRRTCKTLDPMGARRLVDEAAWRGSPPAEGTRRAVILAAIKKGDVLSDAEALEIADTVELALLRVSEFQYPQIFGSGRRSRREALLGVLKEHNARLSHGHGGKLSEANAVDLANEIERALGLLCDNPHIPADYKHRIDTAEEIPPTPMRHTRHFFTEAEIADGWQGEPPAEGTRRKLLFDTLLRLRLDNATHPERILELADEIEQALIDATGLPTEVEQEFRRLQADVEAKQATIDGFAATISEQAHQLDATRGRTNAWVTELAYQVAGAATRPLLEDHGDYVFPAERVQEAVAHLLETYFGIPRACGGCQEEQLEQGRQEAPTADDYMRKAEEEGHMWPKGSPQRRLIEQGRERQSESDRDRPGGSLAGLEAEKALNHLILARRETVDPAELARINEAITAAHMIVEPPSYTATAEAVDREVGEEPPATDDAPGGDDPAATIKYLEGEVERLLGHREEARTREGRFGEERDCAYALLRWLLPVTVAKRLD